MEFFLENKPYFMGIQVYARFQSGNQWGYAKPIEIEIPERKGDLMPPMMTLENQAAQSLMDQLWHCGLRPSEGSGSAGALAATQQHLDDMRAIAFKKLGLSEILK